MLLELQMVAGADRAHPWIDVALASAAADGQTVRIVERVPSLAVARAQAIADSGAQYVAWLDSDDALLPGAARELVAALEASPSAVGAFGNEQSINESGEVIGPGATSGADPWNPLRMIQAPAYGRHLAVFRRSAALSFLDRLAQCPHALEVWYLRCLLAGVGDWLHIPIDSYQHRKHPNNSAKTTPPGAYQAILREVVPILMRAKRRGEPARNPPPPPCSTCSRVRAALGPVGRVLDRVFPL